MPWLPFSFAGLSVTSAPAAPGLSRMPAAAFLYAHAVDDERPPAGQQPLGALVAMGVLQVGAVARIPVRGAAVDREPADGVQPMVQAGTAVPLQVHVEELHVGDQGRDRGALAAVVFYL